MKIVNEDELFDKCVNIHDHHLLDSIVWFFKDGSWLITGSREHLDNNRNVVAFRTVAELLNGNSQNLETYWRNIFKRNIELIDDKRCIDEDEFTVNLDFLNDIVDEEGLLNQVIDYLTFIKNNGLPVNDHAFEFYYNDKSKILYVYDDTFDEHYIIENNQWKFIDDIHYDE